MVGGGHGIGLLGGLDGEVVAKNKVILHLLEGGQDGRAVILAGLIEIIQSDFLGGFAATAIEHASARKEGPSDQRLFED